MPGYFSWGGLSLRPAFPTGQTPSDEVLQHAVAMLSEVMDEAANGASQADGIVHGDFSAAGFEQAIAAVGGLFEEQSAALVQPDGGDLAGRMFAVIDGNGDGQYQSSHDFLLEVFSSGTPLDPVATCIA